MCPPDAQGAFVLSGLHRPFRPFAGLPALDGVDVSGQVRPGEELVGTEHEAPAHQPAAPARNPTTVPMTALTGSVMIPPESEGLVLTGQSSVTCSCGVSRVHPSGASSSGNPSGA